jgi:hypothetical protein
MVCVGGRWLAGTVIGLGLVWGETVTLPAGLPLKVAIEGRLPVDRKAGRAVKARLVEPVYQGSRLVIPEGAELTGRVVAVRGVDGKRRRDALLRADFTPLRQPEIGFTQMEVAGHGAEAIRTRVRMEDGRMVRFAPGAGKKGLLGALKAKAGETVASAKQWLRSPGKVRSVADFVEMRLPYHPQWLAAGTRLEAELAAPVEVEAAGAPVVEAEEGAELPVEGAVVYARLLTPLDSGTAKYGQEVEAEFTRPLTAASGGVVLPEGTKLEGEVSQAQPARLFGRGGKLRFRFKEVVRPDGTRVSMVGTVEGVAAAPEERLKVDQEGGATAQADKSRALSTLFALRSAFDPDADSFLWSSAPGDEPGGIGFLGMVAAIASGRGSGIPLAFGAYNFAHALFTQWLARGREVSYPRNMEIELRLGKR